MVLVLANYRKYFMAAMLFMIVMELINAERASVTGHLNQLKDDFKRIKEWP